MAVDRPTEVLELSDFDRANVHRIMTGTGDWFSAKLLRFIRDSGADGKNLERLRQAFPDHCGAVEWWWNHRADEGPYPGYLNLSEKER
jgi:hypothetical protein